MMNLIKNKEMIETEFKLRIRLGKKSIKYVIGIIGAIIYYFSRWRW